MRRGLVQLKSLIEYLNAGGQPLMFWRYHWSTYLHRSLDRMAVFLEQLKEVGDSLASQQRASVLWNLPKHRGAFDDIEKASEHPVEVRPRIQATTSFTKYYMVT